MELTSIIKQYQPAFLEKYAARLLPAQNQAIHAILRCRTPDSGELYIHCTQCEEAHWKPMSCGHRSCPKCQNHEASQWLERQQAKLLPVEYFSSGSLLLVWQPSLCQKDCDHLYGITRKSFIPLCFSVSSVH